MRNKKKDFCIGVNLQLWIDNNTSSWNRKICSTLSFVTPHGKHGYKISIVHYWIRLFIIVCWQAQMAMDIQALLNIRIWCTLSRSRLLEKPGAISCPIRSLRYTFQCPETYSNIVKLISKCASHNSVTNFMF